VTAPPTRTGRFWYEAVTAAVTSNSVPISKGIWFYCVGIDDNTPVALVAGPDDYTACARARIITKALNDEARAATIAANNDGDD
jgi:hypothetical protein